MNFNAAGSPYAMEYKDALVYAAPYENGRAASVALATTMEKVELFARSAALLRALGVIVFPDVLIG
jgi:hypothetical protein